jgi:hypothetical protein
MPHRLDCLASDMEKATSREAEHSVVSPSKAGPPPVTKQRSQAVKKQLESKVLKDVNVVRA